VKRPFLLLTAFLAAACGESGLVGSESVIAVSPCADSIYLYTPAIAEGFDGRFVVAVDYGGPGTSSLDGPKSDFGDYGTGNQIRVLLSDDRGRHWRETSSRIPMMHEILFKAGESLYMIGHSRRLMITRSDDNGETWSEPSVLCAEGRWHQSCTAVDVSDGKVTLAYEKWVSDGHPWPGVGPVLMQAPVSADLTLPSSWKFSELYNPDPVMEAARPAGLPLEGDGHAGMLETNVVRVVDPSRPFYDPSGRSVVLLSRANTGMPDIGVLLRGRELEDGSLTIDRWPRKDGEVMFAHIPGGHLKFYILYDAVSGLFWLLHSQSDGRMNERRWLALSYSPDLLRWTFAGLVAVGPTDRSARHYATMIVDGDDLCIVSRSGDENARNAHDGNIVTFHRVRNFRKLVR
jgi:hypothetical protein